MSANSKIYRKNRVCVSVATCKKYIEIETLLTNYDWYVDVNVALKLVEFLSTRMGVPISNLFLDYSGV